MLLWISKETEIESSIRASLSCYVKKKKEKKRRNFETAAVKICFSAKKKNAKAKQKRVSASTNPTDRVLKRRPDTFFRLCVRYFLAPLRAWPAASSIAIAREKSTSTSEVKIKQRAGGLGCWPRLLSCDPGACGDVRSNSIDGTHFLSAAHQIVQYFRFLRLAASTSKLTYWSFLFFWPIRFRPANQLFRILVYGDASGSICQLPRGQDSFLQRTASAGGRGCHIALGVAGCAWR